MQWLRVHAPRGIGFPQRADSAPGVVDQLVRAGQHAWTEALADAAHRVERQYAGGTHFAQRGQVGAVIDQVRRQRMTFAMTRQESHRHAGQAARANRS